MPENEKNTLESKGTSHALFLKVTLILGITALLLIPSAMIKGLISERQETKTETIAEIGEKWGKEQTIIGPILTIPYNDVIEYWRNDELHTNEVVKQIYVLPDVLKVNSEIVPKTLNRGIFEVAVYDSQTTFSGSFLTFNSLDLGIDPDNLLLDQAFLSLGVSDLRGIQDQVAIEWAQSKIPFRSGTDISDHDLLNSGIQAQVPVSITDGELTPIEFSVNLMLKGSEKIYFTPVGKTTNVNVASTWPSPSFDGEFLPDTDSKLITTEGFEASWNIVDINRNFPQSWTAQKHDIKSAAFGVNLFIPADNYQKSERSIKYSILFISLTFMVFFFVEIMNNRPVHPIQYILIGLALILFYTLLVSFSEHLPFNLAYLISTGLTIGMVGGYTKAIFKNGRFTQLLTGILTTLYTFIFIIIQMEELALLTGSIGLFIILGLVMYFSRKIDWYSINNVIKV